MEWKRLRSRLNHDWLKNWLMPALSKLLRVANEQIADQEFLTEFSRKLGREWPEKVIEFRTLAEAFPTAMSTASYFDDAPLSALPPDEIEWMRKVTHQRWLREFPASEMADEILAALRIACVSYETLMQAVELTITRCKKSGISKLSEKVETFQLTCKALGDAVSQLPSKPEFSRSRHD